MLDDFNNYFYTQHYALGMTPMGRGCESLSLTNIRKLVIREREKEGEKEEKDKEEEEEEREEEEDKKKKRKEEEDKEKKKNEKRRRRRKQYTTNVISEVMQDRKLP